MNGVLLDPKIVILLAATFSVAFFHTMSPDHWLPFVMVGRAQRWSILKTEVVAFLAGAGHVGTSVAISLIGIFLGAELSANFASFAELATGSALILFGFGYALYMRSKGGHHHFTLGGLGQPSHDHSGHTPATHDGPALATVAAALGSGPAEHYHEHQHASEHSHEHGHESHETQEHVHESGEHSRGEQQHVHEHPRDGHDHDEHDHEHTHHGHDHLTDLPTGSRAGYGLVAIMGLTPCVALLPMAFASAAHGPGVTVLVVVLFAVSTILPILGLVFLGSRGLHMLNLKWFDRHGDVVTGIVIGCIGLLTVFVGL